MVTSSGFWGRLPVVAVVIAMTLPAIASSALATSDASQTTPATSGPSTPEPIPPPADSVFEGTVGGEELGLVGGPPVVADDAPSLPKVQAPCWLVADAATGNVLAARSPHQPRPPASTLKLLTALAALPEIEADATYTATDDAAGVEGSKVGIVPEHTYTLENIMHGVFLSSGNDAAYALGELAGGQDRILDLMNAEADRLGAFDTTAKTPHGLDADGQVSSAYDLALFGRGALQNEQIAELARTRTYDFPGLDGETFQIQNTNRLLGAYDGAIGLKNGYTTNAKHTVVAAAQRDDVTLLVVVMGTEDRAEDAAAQLLDWGFAAVATSTPVGVLVTADDVRAAAEAQESDSADESGTPPPQSGQGDDPRSTDTGDGLSQLMTGRTAMFGGALVAAVFVIVAMTRRRPKRAGRYSARRR